MKIQLGSKAKDIVTGFDGTVTCRAEYLTGCVQYVLTPYGLDKDGKRREAEWFDEMRLEVTEPPAPALLQARDSRASDGGPQDVPRHRLG